jgi:hypothetical protein
MTDRETRRSELRAAVEARRELGPEYEGALVESFLERLDRDIDRRIDARATEAPQRRRPSSDPSLPLALGSLGMGIPISGIAGGTGGIGGLLVAWGGIAAVNIAYAWGRRRGR